jgi:hypothetical protein
MIFEHLKEERARKIHSILPRKMRKDVERLLTIEFKKIEVPDHAKRIRDEFNSK